MDPDASTLEGLLATASSRDAAARAELQQKIQELPSAEQGNLWRAVFSRLTTTVLQVVSEEASEEGCLPLVAICQAAANAGIVCNNLVNTVQFLNGMTSMLEQGALLNSIHDLCVVWCTKKLSEWKQLWLNTFTRVFEQSLMKLSKVKIDKLITTVFIMKDGLATDEITAVQLTAAEQEDLNGHLSKCAASTNYLDRPKGRKFVTFLLTLDKSLARAMYKAMDQALPFMTSAFIEVLAQIYLSAWKEVTGKPQAVALEEDMQEVMHWYVNGDLTEAHHEKLFKFLKVLHAGRKDRPVALMLYRCYLPILWRGLRALHFKVRSNAVKIFFDSFPLLESSQRALQQDELVSQFQEMHRLLDDPCPEVRVLTVKGVFRVLTDFFEMIPVYERKELAMDLINRNALDMNSLESRVQVHKGLEYMIRNPLTHTLLKALIVKNKDSLEDTYSVQLSYVCLLLKARQIPGFKFWDVADPGELLPLVAGGKLTLSVKVATLLRNSYFNPEADQRQNLERCLLLHSLNAAAFRAFYDCLANIAPLLPIVKFLMTICQVLRQNCLLLRKGASQENLSPEKSSSLELSGVEVDTNKTIMNQHSVHVLIETVAITYNSLSLRKELTSKALKADWKLLVALMKKTMNEMFQMTNCLSMQISVLSAACLLPPNEATNLAMRCLSMLRGFLTVPETGAPLVLSMEAKACSLFLCNMHCAADMLGMVDESVEKLKKKQMPVKGRKVRFSVESKPCNTELALQVLRYLLESPQLQIMVLKSHLVPLFNTWGTLLCTVDALQDLLCTSNAKVPVEGTLMTTYDLFLLLTYVLHGQLHPVTKEKFVAISTFELHMKWIEDSLLPKLRTKSRGGCRGLCIEVVKVYLKVARSVLMTTWVSFEFAEKLLSFLVLCKGTTEEDQLKTAVASIPPVVRQFMEIFAKGEEQASIIAALVDKVCFEVPSVKSSAQESCCTPSASASKMNGAGGKDTAAASKCLRPDRESHIRSRRTSKIDTATTENRPVASKCLSLSRKSNIHPRGTSKLGTVTDENTTVASKCLRPDRESNIRSRRTSKVGSTAEGVPASPKCFRPGRDSHVRSRRTFEVDKATDEGTPVASRHLHPDHGSSIHSRDTSKQDMTVASQCLRLDRESDIHSRDTSKLDMPVASRCLRPGRTSARSASKMALEASSSNTSS